MNKIITVNESDFIKQDLENKINNLQNKLNSKPEDHRGLTQFERNQIKNNVNNLYSLLLETKQLRMKQNDNMQNSNEKSIVNRLYSNDKNNNLSNREQLPQFGGQTDRSRDITKQLSKNKSSRKHQLLRTKQKSSARKNSDSKNHTPGLIKTTTKYSQKKESSQKKEFDQQNFLFRNQNVINTFSQLKDNHRTQNKNSDIKSKIEVQTPYKGLLDNISIKTGNNQHKNAIPEVEIENDQYLVQKYIRKQYPRLEEQFKRQKQQRPVNYDSIRIQQLQKQRKLIELQKQQHLKKLRQQQRLQRISQQIYLKQQERKMVQDYKIQKLRNYSHQEKDIYPKHINYQVINTNNNQQSLLEKYTRGERARQYDEILLLLEKQNIKKQLQHPPASYNRNRIDQKIYPEKQQQYTLLKKQPRTSIHQNPGTLRRRNLTVCNINYGNTKNYYEPSDQKQMIKKSPPRPKQTSSSEQQSLMNQNKQQISTSKKRLKFNDEYQQNVKNKANKRIQNRLRQSWAIYADTIFRNNKYESQHLLNTYEKESRLRKQIIEKTLVQPAIQKKFGLLKALQ